MEKIKIDRNKFFKLKLANVSYWKASYIDFNFDTKQYSQDQVDALIYKTIDSLYSYNKEILQSIIEKNNGGSSREYLQKFAENSQALHNMIKTLGPDFAQELIESDYNKHSKESKRFISNCINFYKTREQKKIHEKD